MKNRANLISSAKKIRSFGQGGDSVLAHINPAEARYLQENFGGDINPHTGLPQFGGFFRGLEKKLRKPFKKLAPLVGSVVGGMFGGPAGAVAGGAIGGGLTSKKHMLDHALGGAAVGLGHSFLSPMVGKAFNLNPGSMLGKATMMNAPSWGESLGGMGSIGGLGSSAFKGNRGNAEQPNIENESQSGGIDSMFGTGSLGNLLNVGLLGTGIAGMVGARQKTPQYGTPENESMQQAVHRNKHDWGPMDQYFPPVQKRNEPKFPPKGYRGTTWNFFPTAQEQEEQMLRVNEEMSQAGYPTRYARGGRVKGYFKGKAGGQSDTRPTNLHKDDYVMDATTVSLAGDGNSENGAYKIDKEAKEKSNHFSRSGFIRNPQTSENVRALLSDGEKVITAEQVRAFGGGSIKKGHKELDTFRRNIRKHKGVTKFLPPKSKPLNKYLEN